MGNRGKKNSFFYKKISVGRESNPGPLRNKLLHYQLSHKGIFNNIIFIHGATHISFAKFFWNVPAWYSILLNMSMFTVEEDINATFSILTLTVMAQLTAYW